MKTEEKITTAIERLLAAEKAVPEAERESQRRKVQADKDHRESKAEADRILRQANAKQLGEYTGADQLIERAKVSLNEMTDEFRRVVKAAGRLGKDLVYKGKVFRVTDNGEGLVHTVDTFDGEFLD